MLYRDRIPFFLMLKERGALNIGTWRVRGGLCRLLTGRTGVTVGLIGAIPVTLEVRE